MTLERELHRLLSRVSIKNVDDVRPEDDLVEKLGIDSLTALQLLAAVEKRFNVTFPDERLDEFRSLRDICTHVRNEQEKQR